MIKAVECFQIVGGWSLRHDLHGVVETEATAANEGPQLIEPVAAQVLTKKAGLPAAVAPKKSKKTSKDERQSSLF